MDTPPWYVFTGGPCCGKTKLIRILAARGYLTVPEAARDYIEAEIALGRTLEEIRADELAFQRALLPIKREAERALPRNETVFFDRGMHDSAAYFKLVGGADDADLAAALADARYRKVFLLDRLPYAKDEARTETPEEAAWLHEELYRSYADAGMDVMRIPVFETTDLRADFVLLNL